MQREPSCFWGYVRDDTPSIGSVTGAIMAWSTISCRELFNSFPAFYGDLSSSMMVLEGQRGLI